MTNDGVDRPHTLSPSSHSVCPSPPGTQRYYCNRLPPKRPNRSPYTILTTTAQNCTSFLQQVADVVNSIAAGVARSPARLSLVTTPALALRLRLLPLRLPRLLVQCSVGSGSSSSSSLDVRHDRRTRLFLLVLLLLLLLLQLLERFRRGIFGSLPLPFLANLRGLQAALVASGRSKNRPAVDSRVIVVFEAVPRNLLQLGLQPGTVRASFGE